MSLSHIKSRRSNMTPEQSTDFQPQNKSQGAVCPHCQSSQVFQRMKTVSDSKDAIWTGIMFGIGTFLLLTIIAGWLIANSTPFDYGNSSFLPGSDMQNVFVSLIVGSAAGAISFFASKKNVIYYECMNCKSTW